MNTKQLLSFGVATLAFSTAAWSQTVINITGATAFRAAANDSIIALLGGAGVTQYAFNNSTGGGTVGGTNRAIFRGNVAGIGDVIIRASWSGSTAGIASVASGTPVQVLKTSTPLTTGGNGFAAAASDYETVVASFAFSDVAQAASTTLSPTLTGTEVGVVPFEFVANQSAWNHPLMTNMTDQIFNAMYSTSEVPLRFFTGVPTDNKRVLAAGRNNGSGSRATVLGETQYGFFRGVNQFRNLESGGHTGSGPIGNVEFITNGGNSSNSFLADLMRGTSGNVTLVEAGVPYETGIDVLFLTYLTRSDAIIAAADPDGGGPLRGGKPLTYNGVAYSDDKVREGAYSLWGYQWFYQAPSITATEALFRDAFVAAIPNNLGTAAIPIPDMNVDRFGGDGGPILP